MEKENKKPNVVLPSIKASNSQQRFSSWSTNQTSDEAQDANLDKHLSELDELLLENDELLNPIDKDTGINIKSPPTNDDSFDLENSDDLNKIIDKYESQNKLSVTDLLIQQQGSSDLATLKKISSNNDSFDEAIVDDLDMVEREVNSGRHSS